MFFLVGYDFLVNTMFYLYVAGPSRGTQRA